MKFVVLVCLLLSTRCASLPAEYSVVSVYTTQAAMPETGHTYDVYQQIANNIAERFTSPIYRFFGLNTTTVAPETKSTTTVLATVDRVELIDAFELNAKEIPPVDNNIGTDRDVEELSVAALNKQDKKPEKLTLYSSLIPTSFYKIEATSTTMGYSMLELNSTETFDEDPGKPRDGPIIFVMEFLGSILQLLWGGFMALFNPPNNQPPTMPTPTDY